MSVVGRLFFVQATSRQPAKHSQKSPLRGDLGAHHPPPGWHLLGYFVPHTGGCYEARVAHCLQQSWLRRDDGERVPDRTPLGRKHLVGWLPSANGL